MIKLTGVSRASHPKDRKPSSTPKTSQSATPFVTKTPKPRDRAFGRQKFEGEDELNRLWDTGEIDKLYQPPALHSQQGYEPADPTLGLTEKEYNKKAFGYTPAQDVLEQARRYKLGLTQPTSRGDRVVESNLLAMRRKFDASLQ